MGMAPSARRRAGRLALAVALSVLTGASRPVGQTPPPDPQDPEQPQQPVFRSGVNLVRVDVSVTGRGGAPVDDLQLADFQILEDEVPQQVQTMQFLRLDGRPAADSDLSLDIRSREHAEAEAARDDVRIFAIFLDDYHIDKRPWITLPLREALTHFVNQLGPTDLVTIMEPLTPLSALEFTRSRDALLDRVRSFEGRHGELFPVKSVLEEAQLSRRNITEIRMQVTLSAMTALASYLGGLREGRKSILFVTQGPPIIPYRGDQRTYVDDVVQAANRGNVTINVLDPRRLGSAPFGGTYVQSLLTRQTGGRLIGNTNDLEGGLDQVVEDASAYYLVGYSPSRTFADGKFHRIEVKIRRPGVRVLARTGYWAPTEEELTVASAPAAPPVPGLADSLSGLAGSKTGRPVDAWVGVSRGEAGRTRVTVTWDRAVTPGASPATAVRLGVEPLDGEHGEALAPPQSIARLRAPDAAAVVAAFDLPPGIAALRFTAHGADDQTVDRWTETIELPSFDGAPVALASPRFLRAASPFEYRKLRADPNPTPEAARRFGLLDRVFVDVVCYTDGETAPVVSVELLNAQGQHLVDLPVPTPVDGRTRVEIPVRSLAPSTYVFRARAHVGDHVAERLEAFQIVP